MTREGAEYRYNTVFEFDERSINLYNEKLLERKAFNQNQC